MAKVDEILNNAKLNELIHRNKVEEQRKSSVLWILAIIGAVASVAAIAYGVYRYFNPGFLDDFDGDFDYDELEDDFEDDVCCDNCDCTTDNK